MKAIRISKYVSAVLILIVSCRGKIKEQADEIYSRHLQRHVKLEIITSPMPAEKEEMNLLIFNGADVLKEMDAKQILDSLYERKLIQPVTIVGIQAIQNLEYGIAGLNGQNGIAVKADKFSAFVNNELYPFVKKKVVIRKFHSVAIAGAAIAGISAFDIAWNNADKIDKVGILSGDFNYTGSGDSSNTVLNYVQGSKKRPRMQFWLYAGEMPDSVIFKNTVELGKILRTKKTVAPDDILLVTKEGEGNSINSWRHHFAEFLLWAFAK